MANQWERRGEGWTTGMKGAEQRYSRPSVICSTLLSLLAQIMAFTTITEYQFFCSIFASTPRRCAWILIPAFRAIVTHCGDVFKCRGPKYHKLTAGHRNFYQHCGCWTPFANSKIDCVFIAALHTKCLGIYHKDAGQKNCLLIIQNKQFRRKNWAEKTLIYLDSSTIDVIVTPWSITCSRRWQIWGKHNVKTERGRIGLEIERTNSISFYQDPNREQLVMALSRLWESLFCCEVVAW